MFVEPFLARHAVDRTGTRVLPGRYDAASCLWVVPTPEGDVPLVDSDIQLAELTTKTKVLNEQDDEGMHVVQLAAGTHTAINTEQDDAPLLALLTATITEVAQEADDHH